MRRSNVVLMLAFFVTSIFSTVLRTHSLATNPENEVWFAISHGYWYSTDEDIVTNVPYPRIHQWLFQIQNWADETEEPVVNPNITLFSDREFVGFRPWDPIIYDGEYKWAFALDLPEYFLLDVSAVEPDYVDYACPGFSAERHVSPETLADPVTIQNLSLTLTLEDALPAEANRLAVRIGLPHLVIHGERLVRYSVLSLNSVEDWTFLSNGWVADPSNVSIGKTYNFEATLKAVKSPMLEGTPVAKPAIMILCARWDDLGPPQTGSSATATHPEGPTVTVSAEGEYEWQAGASYCRQDFWLRQVVSEVVENPDPPPPYTVKIPATIDIDPDTLNLGSRGKWITARIELPEGYDVNDLNVSSVMLNDTIPAETHPAGVGDEDDDGIPDFMVKFSRAEVISYILANVNVTELFEERFMATTLTVTGELSDGTLFQGSDTTRITRPSIGRPGLIPT